MPDATPLLIPSSLDALRAKLARTDSPIHAWWKQALTLAQRDPDWFYSYVFLAALVTDEPAYREMARKQFLRFVAMQDEGLTSNDAQFHTHTTSAPLGRLAIYYDWLCDRGVLSSSEDANVRQALLDHAFIFPLQHLQSRYRGFDNQILSNAWGAAAVGHVLGFHRGDSALARRLFASAMTRLTDLLGSLPEGGYSLEGSTYHEQVVQPLLLLSSLLYEAITGQRVIAEGLRPGGRPVRELLETSLRMIGPDGLLPPWDAYGYQHATIKAGVTYLARLTGDHEPLRVIRELNLWYRVAHPAWEVDDGMWTLIFWPDDAADLDRPAAFRPWMIPSVAGSLQSPVGRIRLFQYWDDCGGVPLSGRLQVDPNAIALHAHHSTILLDGSGRPDANVVPLPTEQIIRHIGDRTVESIQEYVQSAWGSTPSAQRAAEMAVDGCVGMSNAIVFDDERWFVPTQPCRGVGEALHHIGVLQAVRSDAASFYRDRYGVTRAARSSLMIDGRYVLVTDRVESATPHRITWQVFARRETTAGDQRAIIRTPELVRCDVIPLQPGTLELTPVSDYPARPDPGSVRIEHAIPSSRNARIDVALIPQAAAKIVANLDGNWERSIHEISDTIRLADAYLSDPATHPNSPRVYRTNVTLAHIQGRKLFMLVHNAAPSATVSLNGKRLMLSTHQPRLNWEDQARSLPLVYDVNDAAVDGVNRVEVQVRFFHGESLGGPVYLVEETPPPQVSASRVSASAFRVTIGNEVDDVLCDNDAGAVPFVGGATDARYAVLTSDGRFAAAGVTTLTLPNNALHVRAQAPCDLAWSNHRCDLASLQLGTSVDIRWDHAEVFIEYGPATMISFRGHQTISLTLPAPIGSRFIVNGELLHVTPEKTGDQSTVTLQLAPPQTGDLEMALTCAEAVYAATCLNASSLPTRLLEALRGDDWRVQLAAADAAGRLHMTAAVPVLLELFERSERELPYPPLKMWWSWSKMLHDESWPTGPDHKSARPLAIKRWRVKRAVVTALGQIGDPAAVAPLERAMARCDDFFPVTSQLAVALGRLGSKSSVSILERHRNHAEINTRDHARAALALIKGEISRSRFEAMVCPG